MTASSRATFSSSPKHARRNSSKLCDYRIIEPFPILRERQRRCWNPFEIKLNGAIHFGTIHGVHFSNELLDALPVRLISGGRRESSSIFNGDKFLFIERPV